MHLFKSELSDWYYIFDPKGHVAAQGTRAEWGRILDSIGRWLAHECKGKPAADAPLYTSSRIVAELRRDGALVFHPSLKSQPNADKVQIPARDLKGWLTAAQILVGDTVSSPHVLTVCVQWGNSDNKLAQDQWASFSGAIHELAKASGNVHFFGGSAFDAPWQNACAVFEATPEAWPRLRQRLEDVRKEYSQGSVAVLTGQPLFV